MASEAILNKYICKVLGEKDFDSCYTSTLLGNNGSQIVHVSHFIIRTIIMVCTVNAESGVGPTLTSSEHHTMLGHFSTIS